jgi:hypothetical protein
LTLAPRVRPLCKKSKTVITKSTPDRNPRTVGPGAGQRQDQRGPQEPEAAADGGAAVGAGGRRHVHHLPVVPVLQLHDG